MRQITLRPQIMLAPGVGELAERLLGPQALEEALQRHARGRLRVEEDEAPIVVDGVTLLSPYFLPLDHDHSAWIALWKERHPEVAFVFHIGPRDDHGREDAVRALRRLTQAEGQLYLLFVSGSELESPGYTYVDRGARACTKDVRDALLQDGSVVIAQVEVRGIKIAGVYWGEIGPDAPKPAFVRLECGPWRWKIWSEVDQVETLTRELADRIRSVDATAFNDDPVRWIDAVVDRHGGIRYTVND